MLGLYPEKLTTILCVGAHCDDIEIGCGGAILQLCRERPDLEIFWAVLSSDAVRAAEARGSASAFLQGVRRQRVVIEEFKDGFLPYSGAQVKERFERLKAEVNPDLIFTHFRGDLHQDHRMVSEMTWNTFRDHFILEYEIPKYDGDLGIPNFFVPLTDEIRLRKIAIIVDCYRSQRDKRWFEPELFSALMRMRGMESNSPSGYAEGFHCRKALLAGY